MNRYLVTLTGRASYELPVNAHDEKDALHEAVTLLEDDGVELEEIFSSNVQCLDAPRGVIPVVEMAALVPKINEDFKNVRDWLEKHPPQNESSLSAQVQRVLDYAQRSVPIQLDPDARESMEIQKGDYIHYWGAFLDDDTTIETCEGEVMKLPENWIEKGLVTLAGLKYHRLGELLSGDYDAESLDCLVQAAVFGEIVYG
jgi:hypothetical protein